MSTAVVAAAGITALALFFFLVEWDGLTESHARPAVHILNAARWVLVIALAWVLIPATFSAPESERAATMVGLAALIGVLMLLPVRWFVRIGGRDPVWALRRIRVEVTHLTNRVRRGEDSLPPSLARDLLARIARSCSPETSELCGLLAAEVQDVVAGTESWNEAGRRSIRIDELSRRLWPDELPPPDHDPEEATFRWRMYRTFGQLVECGVAGPGPEERREFTRVLYSLDQFRRPDTDAFINDVRRSALRWLAKKSSQRRWVEGFDFSVLGPEGLEEIKRIWGRDAAMWGAELEEDDRLAIKADLAKRSFAT